MRRDARHVLAVVEPRAYKVVLPFDTPGAAPDLPHIVLAGELGAIEGGIALLEQHLIEAVLVAMLLLMLVLALLLAGVEGAAANQPGQLAIDEAVEARVIGIGVEAKPAAGALEAGLDGIGLLLGKERVADKDVIT